MGLLHGKSRSCGQIRGCVTTLAGKPVPDSAVLITGATATHKDIAALTDENGFYQLDDLPAGDYSVTARDPGGSSKTLRTRLAPGTVTILDFSLPE